MKAFPTIEFANRSRLAAGYFNNTLGDEDQRLYVRTHAPKSLEEAAKVALAYENAQRIDAKRHAPNPAPKSGRQVRAVDEPHEQPSEQGRGHGKTQGDAVRTADRNAEAADNSSLVRAVTELVGTLQQNHQYSQARGRGRGQGRGGRG